MAPLTVDEEENQLELNPEEPYGDGAPSGYFAVGTLEQMEAFHQAHPDASPSVRPNYVRGQGWSNSSVRNDGVAQGITPAANGNPLPNGLSQAPRPTDRFAPPLSTNFAGIADNNTTIPPDTTGAVGPSNVFEFLNTGRTIYNKTGTVTHAFISFQAFWSSLGTGAGQPANSLSDPRVLWDHYANRWLVTALGFGTNRWLLVGYSQTSDPGGAYNLYAIKVNVSTNGFAHLAHLLDFDNPGFDPNNVIVTGNVFNNSTGAFVHSDVYIINKARLLAGPAGQTLVYNTDFKIVHSPCPNVGANINFTPCVTYGQTPGTAVNYVIDTGWYDTADLTKRYFRVAVITGVGATATYDCLADANFVQTDGCYNFSVANASQPSACNPINAGDTRLASAGVVRNGKIWFTHGGGAPGSPCPDPATSPAATKAEVYWAQQDPALIVAPGLPDQFGVVSDPALAYSYPSIAVNSCEAVMVGFSSTGPNAGQFASAAYTARVATDPPNTMQSVSTYKAGLATYNKTFGGGRNRWGDYSATCVDPTDDQTIWTLQEYASTEVGGACVDGSGRWGTWWGAMPIVCCPTIDTTPGSLPGATIGSAYNQALTPTAGTPGFTFTISAGSLPPNLSLSPAGVISGTPSAAVGTFNFTVKVTDSLGCMGTHNYSITVTCSLPGDTNGDGNINGIDIQHFCSCAVGGSSPGGNCGCADMDTSGSVNELDLPAFLTALGV